MALIDEMKVHMRAGRGGNGVVRWLHEKFKEFGGPVGGDGGKGGDVFVRGVRDTFILAKYKNIKDFTAPPGAAGGGNSKHGANGEDLYIDLPVGSIITNKSSGDVFRLDAEGQEICILKGGHGGRGNEHFKSSTNQQPEEWTAGKNGEEADFFIEVELIASVGLVGLPNAGKSSLLNEITRANAKVGSYAFTTLEPNLGDLFGVILADIPGLIEGAAEGRGLGHKFLRHIKRTKALLHCVSVENILDKSRGGNLEDIIGSAEAKLGEGFEKVYTTIRAELEKFDESMADKKEVILITKTDLAPMTEIEENVKKLTNKGGIWHGKEVVYVSVYDDVSLKKLTEYIVKEFGK